MVKLKNFNIEDSEFVYNLYNSFVKKNFFFTTKNIKIENHIIWLRSFLIKSNFFFIIYYKKKKIGYLRYEKKNKNKFEISIAILEAYQKKGYGKKAFLKSLKKIKNKNIISKIKKNNKKSLKFFQDLGFKNYYKAKKYFVLKYI